MSASPCVSIVTVSYNSGRYIGQCIKSVLNQTYSNIELIVIDGGSSDETLDVLMSFEDDRLFYLSENDSGIYYAMNKGISLVSGEIVAFLNSDNFYASEKVIENVVNEFQIQKTAIVYGDALIVDSLDVNKIVRKWRSGACHRYSFIFGWMPPHQATFFLCSAVSSGLQYNTNFRISADYELLMRFIYLNKLSCSYLQDVFVLARDGGVSNSSLSNVVRSNFEVLLAWVVNGRLPPIHIFIFKPLRKFFQYIH
jgi:glycosyltransferase involved in cell wall biosynthesis